MSETDARLIFTMRKRRVEEEALNNWLAIALRAARHAEASLLSL